MWFSVWTRMKIRRRKCDEMLTGIYVEHFFLLSVQTGTIVMKLRTKIRLDFSEKKIKIKKIKRRICKIKKTIWFVRCGLSNEMVGKYGLVV